MSRRLLALVTLGLVAALAAGCADQVSPAARVGDVTITQGELDERLEEWVKSEALVGVTGSTLEGQAPGTYPQGLVGFVLTQMISFEGFDAEFEAQGLEIDPTTRSQIDQGLFGDPATTAQVWEDVSEEFRTWLVDSIARQEAVGLALGDGYVDWSRETFGADDVEVSSRYGTWDAATGQITGPDFPLAEPLGT